MIKQDLISSNKYDTKCPYSMNPIGIALHNTANDASAKNEVSYMKNNNNEVSYHIAIDDVEAIQVLPFNRNSWATGDGSNGDGNRKYINIEICYSKSGGQRFIDAEKRAAKVIAKLLKDYGWSINKVKKHQDFSGKYCPHRTLDLGWNRFLNMISKELKVKPVQENIKVDDDMYFNEKWYLERYTDVAKAVKDKKFKNGKEHYLKHGKGEGRETVPKLPVGFDEDIYLWSNSDVANAVPKLYQSGVHHWQTNGWKENRIYAMPLGWSLETYLALNKGLKEAIIRDWKVKECTIEYEMAVKEHYIKYGKKEGRRYK